MERKMAHGEALKFVEGCRKPDDAEIDANTYSAQEKGEEFIARMKAEFDENDAPFAEIFSKKPIKAVDLSGNNVSVNYAALASDGYKVSIVKAGQLWDSKHNKINFKSAYFEQHTNGCQCVGMDTGAYVFGMATSVTEARDEAYETLRAVSNVKMTYPIFYDMEVHTSNGKAKNTEIFLAFAEVIQAAGYRCGLYASAGWLTSYVDWAKLKGQYPLWMAAWTEDPSTESKYVKQYAPDVWQWGTGNLDGSHKLDGNLVYRELRG
ncbi:hypothetical protein FACS1894105_04360 [Clostridia bacterium]|nr:hypothetical protein FACS1894105_04360 [Clostridia bacterium]